MGTRISYVTLMALWILPKILQGQKLRRSGIHKADYPVEYQVFYIKNHIFAIKKWDILA